jgi:hypothetical protein
LTVWVYINAAKEVGDVDHMKAFANEDAAERWFAKHDPEDVALEYTVLSQDPRLADQESSKRRPFENTYGRRFSNPERELTKSRTGKEMQYSCQGSVN